MASDVSSRPLARYWPTLLFLFLLSDLAYSCWQHAQAAISGDLSNIVLPSTDYQPVLTDPLGLRALRGETYAAPNRFFQHQTILQYFRAVPGWLQHWFSPVDSLYAACALAKTLMQALLIYLLGAYISGHRALTSRAWLVAAALVTPLFHTNGWTGQIGIIDKSVVYSFCYALPVALLLLFFWPYARAAAQRRPVRLSAPTWVLLLGLAVVLTLNSPIATGVLAILCPGILLYCWQQRLPPAAANEGILARSWAAVRALPKELLPLVVATLLSLYSLYIGRLNAENLTATLPLAERYARLPLGVFYQFKQKLGWPLLLALLGVNYWLLRRLPDTRVRRRLLTALRWIGLFAAVYVLLLPLGGYREYRPFILRRDTLLPVIIAVIYWYGAAACYLLRHLAGPTRVRYGLGLTAVLLVFTLTDLPNKRENRNCERAALLALAQASAEVVVLDSDCPVLNWERYSSPEQSAVNAAMLRYWGVTPRVVLYYHRQP
ncbi:hypothetical protein EJV47_19460 [Hymenobacter gummosus]|uniref:Glycosyltransferase RgtA/B/C/D-like domain-containing protein n=1 Tax=Hymenobacter gummosus TaxID=1776032 RepID=A0A431TZ13_9BACT|nr:hypothetical protein [Hymenobacter gummosus]RTQ47594.1 hypothetical protein EJV47_19460 [Hymenobacter gummosus]